MKTINVHWQAIQVALAHHCYTAIMIDSVVYNRAISGDDCIIVAICPAISRN